MRDNLKAVIDVKRTEWGARQPARQLKPAPNLAPWWEDVEVHHGGADNLTRDGMEGVPAIQNAQINSGRYSDIWYHLLIDASGKIFEGRGVDWMNNSQGRRYLTVQFVGGYTTAGANPLQLEALQRIRQALVADNPTASNVLRWHRERDATACPGDKLVDQLRAIQAKELSNGGFIPPAEAEPRDPEWYLENVPGVVKTEEMPVALLAHDALPGYAIVTVEGGVFTFGGFPFLGSVPGQGLNILDDDPVDFIVSAAVVVRDGQAGYAMVTSRGAVFNYGSLAYAGRMDVKGD